jgi:hypothetical protein
VLIARVLQEYVMDTCEIATMPKMKLTHLESKKESHLPACKQATSLTKKRNAGKIKKSTWFLYAEEAPLCGVFLNFRPCDQDSLLQHKTTFSICIGFSLQSINKWPDFLWLCTQPIFERLLYICK